MSENEDVKKVDIIDEETKSLLGDVLDITKDIRKIVAQEIIAQKQIVKNFDKNKEEYIEAIDELKKLDEMKLAEQKQKHLEALKKLKERLNG
jgi:hypothetical protein